uniref:Uncharacterized protein n=1 Tax=Arundo donax TaxID=35708 RepID=A0A0A9FBQ3_ARUDO
MKLIPHDGLDQNAWYALQAVLFDFPNQRVLAAFKCSSPLGLASKLHSSCCGLILIPAKFY